MSPRPSERVFLQHTKERRCSSNSLAAMWVERSQRKMEKGLKTDTKKKYQRRGRTASRQAGLFSFCGAHAERTGTRRSQRPMTNGDEGLVTNLPLASRKAPVATEWFPNEYKTALRGLLAAGYNIRTACEGSGGQRCRSLCCLSGSFYEFYPTARWVLQTGGMWKTTKMTH